MLALVEASEGANSPRSRRIKGLTDLVKEESQMALKVLIFCDILIFFSVQTN